MSKTKKNRRKALSDKLFNEVFDKIPPGKEITIYIEHKYLEVDVTRSGAYENDYYDVIDHDSSVTAAQAIKKVIDFAMEKQKRNCEEKIIEANRKLREEE